LGKVLVASDVVSQARLVQVVQDRRRVRHSTGVADSTRGADNLLMCVSVKIFVRELAKDCVDMASFGVASGPDELPENFSLGSWFRRGHLGVLFGPRPRCGHIAIPGESFTRASMLGAARLAT
jgi:hypothetical protein